MRNILVKIGLSGSMIAVGAIIMLEGIKTYFEIDD